ncbi:MAG: hypothetical protein Q8O38_03405 [Sulfurimicrobium sp.]|nr:hypothetical protein [Sulfurimicrobium sp.]
MHIFLKFLMAVFLLISSPGWAAEVALVTAIKGDVWLGDETDGMTPLQAFIKLRDGDILQLGDKARLQLVYFQSNRQETWSGPGNVEVAVAQGRMVAGMPSLQTQQLSPQLAKQIARTPAPDSKGKLAALRTRSLALAESLGQVQKTYQDMRARVASSDRNPELYLLSAYFELREYDRIQEALRQLGESYPGDLEIKVLKSLYVKAISNAKMAAK